MNECNKRNKCGCGLDLAVIPAAAGDDTGSQKPYNGAYQDTLVKYEANGHLWFYTHDGVPTFIPSSGGGGGTDDFDDLNGRPKYADEEMTSDTNIPSVEELREYVGEQAEALRDLISDEATARSGADTALGTRIDNETLARQGADNNLQSQIDAISASSDVTDIVGTYADLQNYDTSTLGDNDIIKVLQDESQNDETTYYRWSTTTQTFTLIGEEGPYYTKSAADAKFQDKLTPGANITIDANNEISATDTTYSDFTGTDGSVAGTSGLVPAPATTDADKFLKSDGTWDTAGGGTLYSTTGTNTDGAMTQLAASNMIYPSGDETTKGNIFIQGGGAGSAYYTCIGPVQVSGFVNIASGSTAIGQFATATGSKSLAIAGGAQDSTASGTGAIAIGGGTAQSNYGIAIGYQSAASLDSVGFGHTASTTSANYSVAVGSNAATTNNAYGVAIGYMSRAFGGQSIAIGSRISTSGQTGTVVIGNGPANNTQYATRNNEFCVHASTTANQPMVHSNVDTPTLGTDAANKDYVDTNFVAKTSTITTTVNFTNKSLPITFTRCGDLVFVSANYATSNVTASDQTTLSETVPSGYRPVAETAFATVEVVSSESIGGGQGFLFATDGTVKFSTPSLSSNGTRFHGSTCWMTNDAFPV